MILFNHVYKKYPTYVIFQMTADMLGNLWKDNDVSLYSKQTYAHYLHHFITKQTEIL